MEDSKGYYSLFGFTEEDKKLPFDEFKKKLKKKYKEMALKYHPDRQEGKNDKEKKEAEDKFKEIGEAYEILSDEAKKKEYDNPMSGFKFEGSPFGANPFGDMEDIFDNFGFGFGNRKRNKQNQIVKGQNIRITLDVSLEDLYNGITKQIRYTKKVQCHDCNGSGMTSESTKETCPNCGGVGTIFSQNGAWQTITTCPNCGGLGYIVKNPCKKCHGDGVVDESVVVDINIAKGFPSNSQMILHGKGNAVKNGIDGDLLVVINEIPHAIYKRQGNDLLISYNIPIVDALLGCEKEIQTIDGKKIVAKIKPLTKNETVLRFKGKGMPIYGQNGFGDMYAVFKYVTPEKLSDEEIETLKQLQGKGNFV